MHKKCKSHHYVKCPGCDKMACTGCKRGMDGKMHSHKGKC